MKEKKDCKIVQDLLPNYIEKLTLEETNEYIENHIKGCSECTKVLKDMKNEIKDKSKDVNKKEVNYLKRYNRKLKFLTIILLLIIIIYVVSIGNKILILNQITSKAQNSIENSNYYIRVTSFSGTTMRITETYKKGEKQITTLKYYDSKNIEQGMQYIYYINENKVNCYIQYNNKKIEKVGSETVNEYGFENFPIQMIKTLCTYNEDIGLLMKNAIMSSVNTIQCNGKECYHFSNLENTGMAKNKEGIEVYFDKETGLPIRATGGTVGSKDGIWDEVIDLKYEFNTVTDSNVEEPIVSE